MKCGDMQIQYENGKAMNSTRINIMSHRQCISEPMHLRGTDIFILTSINL